MYELLKERFSFQARLAFRIYLVIINIVGNVFIIKLFFESNSPNSGSRNEDEPVGDSGRRMFSRINNLANE